MSYQTVHINPRLGSTFGATSDADVFSDASALSNQPRVSVLVIYTGGTLGMVSERKTGQLIPFNFERVLDQVPELHRLDFDITLITLRDIIDSSNMKPANWVELANIIQKNYDQFNSFVILHGTDTMAYTASALSFMLVNLAKPVILTGAQLPIGVAHSDARENFITALEIAAAQQDGKPLVPEVCVYFNSQLLRGNRSTKQESVHFNAFHSENYPHLALAGVKIEYNFPFIRPCLGNSPFRVRTLLDANVTILKLFPGITQPVVQAILTIPKLKGVVLETFGAGNAPTYSWFLDELRKAVDRGILIFNVSQCEGGRVTQGQYQTSKLLQQIGVVSGADITTEAAITKMMVVLGEAAGAVDEDEPIASRRQSQSRLELLRQQLAEPMCGEMSL
jgi:L-asparaginase